MQGDEWKAYFETSFEHMNYWSFLQRKEGGTHNTARITVGTIADSNIVTKKVGKELEKLRSEARIEKEAREEFEEQEKAKYLAVTIKNELQGSVINVTHNHYYDRR